MNASQKQYSYHLNAGRQAQFTINIDNPVANFLLNSDSLIKVYRQTKVSKTWELLMVGDTIHAEESGQGDLGLLTVVAADPWWRLQRRLIGMDVNGIGQGVGFTAGSPTGLVDIGAIIMFILGSLNTAFNTGISAGTYATSTTSYLGPVYAQNAGDIIQQLCNTLGGPDFAIIPNEPTGGAMPATTIGTLNVYNPLGSIFNNTVFEYGTGQRNTATYDRILSKDGLANYLFSPPQGFPDVPALGDTMVSAIDLTSVGAIGLYEDIVQGDVISQPLRQELCNEYLAIRGRARQQITFTPTVDCPLDYGVDYDTGDVVVARAFVPGSGYRYNGYARIYGVDIAVDDNDAETPALTLIPGTS